MPIPPDLIAYLVRDEEYDEEFDANRHDDQGYARVLTRWQRDLDHARRLFPFTIAELEAASVYREVRHLGEGPFERDGIALEDYYEGEDLLLYWPLWEEWEILDQIPPFVFRLMEAALTDNPIRRLSSTTHLEFAYNEYGETLEIAQKRYTMDRMGVRTGYDPTPLWWILYLKEQGQA